MIKSNLVSKIISSLSVLMLLSNILFSGYIVSLHKKQIDDKVFTISQSLAFGNEIALVVLIVIAFALFGFVIYYRKQSKPTTVIRLFLLLVALVFLITIVWITTFRNGKLHYIFALIIFLSAVIVVFLNSYSLWKEKINKKLYEKIIILAIPILTILSLVGLGIGGILPDKKIGGQVFASFENILLTCVGGSMLSLGFI
jgi:hypothetical protein